MCKNCPAICFCWAADLSTLSTPRLCLSSCSLSILPNVFVAYQKSRQRTNCLRPLINNLSLSEIRTGLASAPTPDQSCSLRVAYLSEWIMTNGRGAQAVLSSPDTKQLSFMWVPAQTCVSDSVPAMILYGVAFMWKSSSVVAFNSDCGS